MVVPALNAVTAPVEASTDATAGLLLLHDPPASPSLLYVDDWPIQSGEVPLIVPAFALGLTVTIFDALTGLLHPVLTVYVKVVEPAPTAVTAPDVAFTVATPVLLLLQLPPASPVLLYVAD